jgi:hypothetical protein
VLTHEPLTGADFACAVFGCLLAFCFFAAVCACCYTLLCGLATEDQGDAR